MTRPKYFDILLFIEAVDYFGESAERSEGENRAVEEFSLKKKIG